MVSKQEINKRRVSANKEAARQKHVVAKAARRRKRGISIGVGILALALIAPLTVGLIAATQSDEPEIEPIDAPAPTTVEESSQGAALTGGDESTDTGTVAVECPAEDGSSPRTINFSDRQPMCIEPTQTHVAVFDTSEGEVRVTLDSTNTPLTVNNFATLARWGYYDGTTLFRTDPSIDIIQGGSPHTESASDPGPGYSILDEPQFKVDAATGQVFDGPYRYRPGQLVMARSGGPDAASGQFFFTTGPNAAALDGQGVYVVFGESDDASLRVLQDIIGLHVAGGSLGGAPSRTVTVKSVTIEVSE